MKGGREGEYESACGRETGGDCGGGFRGRQNVCTYLMLLTATCSEYLGSTCSLKLDVLLITVRPRGPLFVDII